MKSPWKLLAHLTSRRRPAERRESPVGDDTEASGSDARPTSALSSSSTGAASGPDHTENPTVDIVTTATSDEIDGDLDRPQVDGDDVQTPAPGVSGSGAGVHGLEPEYQKGKTSPRSPRTQRAKRTKIVMVSESTAVAIDDQSAQSPSSRDNFFNEVVSLDEEIMQLRSQLAQKLYLQNAQLIKMLERFDGS
ncbi:hypothetical protein LJR235_005359 [Pararhizobium sp. LjRoot235]|uniref:hypothetical protein n=1 Tax=Pararhizobium sp. LjRoot235 TaxID=3342291 RepID=UPI003ECF00DC